MRVEVETSAEDHVIINQVQTISDSHPTHHILFVVELVGIGLCRIAEVVN